MPAPSSMSGRQKFSSSRSTIEGTQGRHQDTSGEFHQGNRVRCSSDPTAVSEPRMYAEVFTSRPVTESKTMLWEIKDFMESYQSLVQRAMNFEFEVGRLGSMEKHLPRKSRWKIMFDSGDDGGPALRVLQLSPESRTIFYKLEAWIMDGTGDGLPENEAQNGDYKTHSIGFREGRHDCKSAETLVPFAWQSHYGDFLMAVSNYMREGSLFVKIKMAVLEDASSQLYQ